MTDVHDLIMSRATRHRIASNVAASVVFGVTIALADLSLFLWAPDRQGIVTPRTGCERAR